MPRVTASLAALLFLVACAQSLRIDAFPAAAVAAPPTLVPLDRLLAEADTSPAPRAALLDARAARLKARAALMRGEVLDPATRARLANAIRAGQG